MSRIPPALAVAVLAAVPLAGCSITTPMHPRTSGAVQSVRALQLGWRTAASEPEWVPADATDIRFTATTSGPADETPASVRVTTASALPRTCTTADRRSSATYRERWAPTTLPDRVHRCGNWAVVAVRGGWFGWTPFAPVRVG